MRQRKRKKSKRGSSSSETEEVMASSARNGDDSMYNDLKNSLDRLRQVVSEGFVKLHTDLDKLRFEFKTEIEAVKLSIKNIEKSLTYTQSEVEGLKEHFDFDEVCVWSVVWLSSCRSHRYKSPGSRRSGSYKLLLVCLLVCLFP